jgi:nicotinic acid phosphoribosyltransferase
MIRSKPKRRRRSTGSNPSLTPFPYGSPSLLTDLYELTMACAYWKSGLAEKEAVFLVCFRRPPFQSGFTIASGLAA